jgi:hypothetical protein
LSFRKEDILRRGDYGASGLDRLNGIQFILDTTGPNLADLGFKEENSPVIPHYSAVDRLIICSAALFPLPRFQRDFHLKAPDFQNTIETGCFLKAS